MNEIEELAELKKEIANLKARKAALEEIKRLKIEKIKAKLALLPSDASAKHPILGTIGGFLYKHGRHIAQNAYKNALENQDEALKRKA